MRISDWSSDVCSSDLEQGFEFSLMRAGGAEWHQCKRQTAAGTWSIAALDGAGVLSAFRAKTSSTGTRCLFVSSDPSPQLKLLQDKLPAAHSLEAFEASLSKMETQHWGVLKNRSEEHTSELQSLMRISYAVFCSKK